MKKHFYLDWYGERGFSKTLVSELQKHITNRKALVFISALPNDNQVDFGDEENVFERTWFDRADIFFDAYHLIDDTTKKEEAKELIQEASTIFLCGGYPQYQMQLLTTLELKDLIKESEAVVMGTSAGGMNMSEVYIDEERIFKGLALHPFAFEAHFNYADKMLLKERFVLSNEINLYVAADEDGAVMVIGNAIGIIGNVYLVSHSQLNKLAQTPSVKGLDETII